MTILLVAMWMFVFVFMIRAVLKKEILMPGKDEDKGGILELLLLDCFNWLTVADFYKEDDEKHGIPVPP